jgi:IS30 family transposase
MGGGLEEIRELIGSRFARSKPQRSAIGTLVERTTRFTMLIHLPRAEGYGVVPRTKNGPALAGYGAVTTADALARTITTLPRQLRPSVTWDRGKELSDHARFTVDTGVKVYFANPKSPWQRGTNEDTNGLLRQYFPRGTDLCRWSSDDLPAVAHTLNTGRDAAHQSHRTAPAYWMPWLSPVSRRAGGCQKSRKWSSAPL